MEYLFVNSQNIQAIVQQKVAGELVSPINMMHSWYDLKGVFKAAFHWSSSLI